MHLSPLIQDLALILISAAVVTLLFKKMKQPVVLGYLIAGFLVGPNFQFFPSIQDPKNIAIWAEIGVIFMLFGLGLEFNFKKLAKVGRSATITAGFEVFCMLAIGYFTGRFLGWSRIDSLFLGGILSISSTTIIVKAFEELGLKGKEFVPLVFGVLIVEDLIAILLLVLFSSIAATQSLSGIEVVFSGLRLGFFLVFWFLLGIYFLPVFLRRFQKFLSDETMLIVSLGLCLIMVMITNFVGFSPALGAFIMGSLLAETSQGHRIERLLVPVKNLFSAVFFVSIGMLINVETVMEHYPTIAVIFVVTILGKFLSTFLGSLLSGKNLKVSVQSGMSLAQIGEFSFIIATLGATIGVTSGFVYPVAVAVSALTTFTTPYLIKYSPQFAGCLQRRLPENLKEFLLSYEKTLQLPTEKGIFTVFWQAYGLKIILNSTMVLAITFGVSRVLLPRLGGSGNSSSVINFISCVLALIFAAPFLWAIFLGPPAKVTAEDENLAHQLKRLRVGVIIFRFACGLALIGFIVSNFESILALPGVIFAILAVTAIFFLSRFSAPVYRRIENRFLSNLIENERGASEKSTILPILAPWDMTLAELTVSPHSTLIAKSLQDSGLKEKFGVTITMIERGKRRILAPHHMELLLPYDRLFLIGTDGQIAAVRSLVEPAESEFPLSQHSIGLRSHSVKASDAFTNKSLRDSGIRETFNGLIVGIEREGQRYLSPDPNMVLMTGDLIWVVGDDVLLKKISGS